jgi:hypothetical protein
MQWNVINFLTCNALSCGSPCRIELVEERLEFFDSDLAIGPCGCPVVLWYDGVQTYESLHEEF